MIFFSSSSLAWVMDIAIVDFSVAVSCHSGLLWGTPKVKANISLCLQMCRTLKKINWYIKNGDEERETVPGKSLFIVFPFLFFLSKTDTLDFISVFFVGKYFHL